MKIIPTDVLEPNSNLLDENNFITVQDPKHIDKSFHYTSWCKDSLIKTLLDLEHKHIEIIENLIEKFSEKFLINKENFRVIIHFPPNFWRLHIHFIAKNHEYPKETNISEVYDIYEILNNLRIDTNYYRKRVKIVCPTCSL